MTNVLNYNLVQCLKYKGLVEWLGQGRQTRVARSPRKQLNSTLNVITFDLSFLWSINDVFLLIYCITA